MSVLTWRIEYCLQCRPGKVLELVKERDKTLRMGIGLVYNTIGGVSGSSCGARKGGIDESEAVNNAWLCIHMVTWVALGL